MSSRGPLVFIDTNIFLDFYRATGSADFKLLDRIKEIQGEIITSHQVEMEFQKNRQKILSASFEKLKIPPRPEIPGLFVGTTELEEFNAALEVVKKRLNVLQDKLSAAMKEPETNDPVYAVANNVFSFESDFNLTRAKPQRFKIRRLARGRFLLGYPPRKDQDTSIGDAVNWEWIVECATKSGRSVVVVSRDADYGLKFGDRLFLNEWLRKEFAERLNNGSEIKLTDSLSAALEELKVHVTKAEKKAEEKIINEANLATSVINVDSATWESWTQKLSDELIETFLKSIGRKLSPPDLTSEPSE
jgi:predicted nucleic acid-binding protein